MFTTHFGHYMPLTWVTCGLDYVLWGMNPAGYHASSLFYHALAAVLLFFFLDGLLRRAVPDAAPWAAVAGALFFSIHPLRVESVAWITERRDLVSGCFFLLSLIAYLKSTDGPARWKWIALSCAAFAGSILSKAMGMTLPLVLLLLDVWPLRRFGKAALIEKIPFFVLSAVAVALTSWAQTFAEAIYTTAEYPPIQSLAQPGYRVSFYALKTLLPFGLSPLYFYRPDLGLPHVAGWTALVAITALVLIRRKQAPALAVAWLAFGLLIAPVSGLKQAGPHAVADRYTYLACLPFAALFAAAIALPRDPKLRNGVVLMAAVLLSMLAAISVRQCAYWKDSVAIWDRAIAIEPDVYFSWQKRGAAKVERSQWKEAEADFNRAVELNPRFPDSYSGRAQARSKTGDLTGAVRDFTRVLELRPGSAATHFNRGMAFLRLGRPAGALADFNRALELRPDDADALAQRGVARSLQGDPDGGLADLGEAVKRKGDAGTLLLRATVRGMKGDFKGVADDCTQAIAINPAAPDAYFRRGLALMELGDKAAAAGDFRQVLERAPPNSPLHGQAGAMLKIASQR